MADEIDKAQFLPVGKLVFAVTVRRIDLDVRRCSESGGLVKMGRVWIAIGGGATLPAHIKLMITQVQLNGQGVGIIQGVFIHTSAMGHGPQQFFLPGGLEHGKADDRCFRNTVVENLSVRTAVGRAPEPYIGGNIEMIVVVRINDQFADLGIEECVAPCT